MECVLYVRYACLSYNFESVSNRFRQCRSIFGHLFLLLFILVIMCFFFGFILGSFAALKVNTYRSKVLVDGLIDMIFGG